MPLRTNSCKHYWHTPTAIACRYSSWFPKMIPLNPNEKKRTGNKTSLNIIIE